MKPSVQKILTKLAKEKVELSLISNFESEIQRIEYKNKLVKELVNDFKSKADTFKSHWYAEFKSVILDLEESQAAAKKYATEITEKAKELGMDAGKIVKDYQRGSTLANKGLEEADKYFRIISKL